MRYGECRSAGRSDDCLHKERAGTHIYVASKAIAVGDVCHSVAGGKVTDAAGVAPVCRAVTAAAVDGDFFEGIPTTET